MSWNWKLRTLIFNKVVYHNHVLYRVNSVIILLPGYIITDQNLSLLFDFFYTYMHWSGFSQWPWASLHPGRHLAVNKQKKQNREKLIQKKIITSLKLQPSRKIFLWMNKFFLVRAFLLFFRIRPPRRGFRIPPKELYKRLIDRKGGNSWNGWMLK